MALTPLGEIGVKATASVKWPTMAEAQANLAKAQNEVARAESVAPYQSMSAADLADALRAHQSAHAFAERKIEAIQAEQLRRKG